MRIYSTLANTERDGEITTSNPQSTQPSDVEIKKDRMDWRKHSSTIGILALLILGGIQISIFDKFQPLVRIYLSDVSATQAAEIFLDTGKGYNSGQRVPFRISSSPRSEVYRIKIPSLVKANTIRLDLANQQASFIVERIRISTIYGEYKLEGTDLLSSVRVLHQAKWEGTQDDFVRFTSLGLDSQLELVLPEEVRTGLELKFLAIVLAGIVISLPTIWVSLRLILLFSKHYERLRPHKIKLLIATPLTLSVLLVGGKLHFSSIDMWNAYLPEENAESSVLIGSALGIRSDEWVTQTPWTLSQWHVNQPLTNSERYPDGLLWLISAPTQGVKMVAQPKFWGSLLFDIERSFSWLWTYKSIGLMCSLYFFFNVLCRNHFYSLIGTILIYGASSTQWWFSSNLPEILIGFCLAVASTLCLLSTRHRRTIYLMAGFVWLSSASLLMHPYPPFIIPLFHLGLILFIFYVFAARDTDLRIYSWHKLAALGVACSGIGIFGAYLYLTGQPAIDIISKTVYPGTRISVGGEVNDTRYLSAFFEFWRSSPHAFPVEMGNASEASATIPFWILAFPILLLIWRTKPYKEAAVTIFCAGLTAYMIVGVPQWVAVSTLLKFVPGPRAIIALGIAGAVILVLISSRLEEESNVRPLFIRLLLSSITFCSILACGYYLQTADPFYSTARVFASSTVLSLLVFGIISRSRGLVLLCSLLIVAPSISVNPLATGLKPLLNKPVFTLAGEISGPSSTWLVIGNGVFSQAFVANGHYVKFGQQYVPNFSDYKIIDPKSENEAVWNRYARINVLESKSETASFDLIQGDNFSIFLDPCAQSTRDLGVTHIASQSNLDHQECLTPKSNEPVNGIFLYKYTDSQI